MSHYFVTSHSLSQGPSFQVFDVHDVMEKVIVDSAKISTVGTYRQGSA